MRENKIVVRQLIMESSWEGSMSVIGPGSHETSKVAEEVSTLPKEPEFAMKKFLGGRKTVASWQITEV
jgi:hypothetical protein